MPSFRSKLEASSLRNIPPIFSYARVILKLFRDYVFQMQMEFKSTLVGFYKKYESMFVTLWCLQIS